MDWTSILIICFTAVMLLNIFNPTTGEPRATMVGNYRCKHFDISGGMSLEILKKMQGDGLSQERLEEFATLDFLQLDLVLCV